MSPKPRVASRRLALVASGRKLAFGHGRLARFVLALRFAQVFGGGCRDDGIITHEAERGVARMAEEAAHPAAGVRMIHEQRPRRLGLADAADAALLRHHGLVVLQRQPINLLEPLFAAVPFVAGKPPPRPILVILGIGLARTRIELVPVGRTVGAVAGLHLLAILGILGIALSLPLAVGTHRCASSQPGRANGGRYRAAARASVRAPGRRCTIRKQSHALRSSPGDGGTAGHAPATAAASGGLVNAIHDLVLGYWPAPPRSPKPRAPTASNSFESAGRQRRAEATAAIIQD